MSEAPAILLLHGFTNSGASWQPVISGLGQRYRAIAPDIRGHASASGTAPVTLDAVLADIAAHSPEQFALVGYSQGGRIALHAALALPRRVTQLILIGSSPGLQDEAERADRQAADERLAEQIETLSIDEFAVMWAQTPVLGDISADVAAIAHEDRLRSTPRGLAAALRGLGTGALPALWDRLPELRMPVELIAGARDTKFTEVARQMAQRIPQANLTIVPDVGHAVHLEQPEAVVALLQRVVPADQSVAEP